MAFKKRKKIDNLVSSKVDDDSNKPDDSSTFNKNLNNNQKEFSAFKEQAKHILNVLESSGIDIYDETRKPGMYLESRSWGKKSKILPINRIVNKGKNNKENNDQKLLNKLFGKK